VRVSDVGREISGIREAQGGDCEAAAQCGIGVARD
jgi:hypothetical protein